MPILPVSGLLCAKFGIEVDCPPHDWAAKVSQPPAQKRRKYEMRKRHYKKKMKCGKAPIKALQTQQL